MKKKLTTNACYTGALLLFVGAIGCGSAIELSTNGLAMLGWSIAAVALLGVSLVLVALGVSAETKTPESKPLSNDEPRQTRKGA